MTTHQLSVSAVNRFNRRGWLIVRGLFSSERVEGLRHEVFQSLERVSSGLEPPTDLLANPALHGIVHDPDLIRLAQQLLGGQPVYFGDASYAIVGRGYDELRDATGYHRDNTDRSDTRAPDWQSPYTLVRFGIYLQDHRHHSGGLLVRNGSHMRMNRGWKNYLHDRYLNTEVGDVGVWNMRLQHAGVGRAWRFASFWGIPPAIQDRIPKSLQLPRWTRERAAIWVSYGREGPHLERHCKYLLTRTERLEMWRNSYYSDDVLAQCAKAGLRVIDMPARMRAAVAEGAVPQHAHHYQMAY